MTSKEISYVHLKYHNLFKHYGYVDEPIMKYIENFFVNYPDIRKPDTVIVNTEELLGIYDYILLIWHHQQTMIAEILCGYFPSPPEKAITLFTYDIDASTPNFVKFGTIDNGTTISDIGNALRDKLKEYERI